MKKYPFAGLVMCLLLMSALAAEAGNTFVDNGDGTVSDSSTGLMWQQATGGIMEWDEAKFYCETLTLAGYEDWRMPTIQELRTLVDFDMSKPLINENFSSFTFLRYNYWSFTTVIDENEVFTVSFDDGLEIVETKERGDAYIRAVRGNFSPKPSSVFDEVTLDLTVKRAELGDYKIDFVLKYYENPNDSNNLYWVFDENSLKVYE